MSKPDSNSALMFCPNQDKTTRVTLQIQLAFIFTFIPANFNLNIINFDIAKMQSLEGAYINVNTQF